MSDQDKFQDIKSRWVQIPVGPVWVDTENSYGDVWAVVREDRKDGVDPVIDRVKVDRTIAQSPVDIAWMIAEIERLRAAQS